MIIHLTTNWITDVKRNSVIEGTMIRPHVRNSSYQWESPESKPVKAWGCPFNIYEICFNLKCWYVLCLWVKSPEGQAKTKIIEFLEDAGEERTIMIHLLDVSELQPSKTNFQGGKNIFFLRDYQLCASKKLGLSEWRWNSEEMQGCFCP